VKGGGFPRGTYHKGKPAADGNDLGARASRPHQSSAGGIETGIVFLYFAVARRNRITTARSDLENHAMGLTKRIWIDRDPAYENVRRQHLDGAKLDDFKFRIPTHRTNSMPGPRWCPIWRKCLGDTAARLNFEHRWINAGMFFRTEAERDAVWALAETLREERVRARGW
jgi:hypothetical protein